MRHISRLGLGRGVVDSRRIVETRGRGSRPAVGERAEDECPEAEAAGEKGKLTAKPPPPRCRAYWCVPESSFAFTCRRAKHGPASTRRRSDRFAERLARRRRARMHPLFACRGGAGAKKTATLAEKADARTRVSRAYVRTDFTWLLLITKRPRGTTCGRRVSRDAASRAAARRKLYRSHGLRGLREL